VFYVYGIGASLMRSVRRRANVVGWFTVSAPDNDSYMCGSRDVLDPIIAGIPMCHACGFKTDSSFVNHEFRLKCVDYDLSYTYDGYAIASAKFASIVASNGLTGASFVRLPASPGFFLLIAESTVEFDIARRQTRFDAWCPVCERYASVAGATPAFLRRPPVADIARTDVEFGSGNERQPLLIASTRAKEAIACGAVRGPEFSAVAV
jgi:hypothetical protein